MEAEGQTSRGTKQKSQRKNGIIRDSGNIYNGLVDTQIFKQKLAKWNRNTIPRSSIL